VDVGDAVNRFALYFASLPREARAVPRFEERFLTALMFMGLAVGCFWMAITAFM